MNDMKKLLILCSVPQMVKIVKRAIELGLYTIVIDNIDGSPCKKISHESHNISVFDIEAIVKLAKSKGVDGIINYCIDSGQIPYCVVANKLNLPCYGTLKQFEIMTNKEIFKEYCYKFGLSVLKSYNLNDNNLEYDSIEFPIVIKPVDGRASKGVNICWNSKELGRCISESLKHSKKKRVVAEEFVQNGQEVAVKYFVCNGNISLTSMSDIYTHYDNEGNRDYIWSQVFPSKHYEHYVQNYDEKVRSFIEFIGIKNGPLSFSGFRKGEEYYFIDPSFRMGGAEDWEIVKANSGIDISEIMTQFAVTGSMGDFSQLKKTDKSVIKSNSMMLYFLVKEGIVGNIIGVNSSITSNNVVSHHVMYNEGEIIEFKGTVQQVIMRFIIVAQSKQQMIETAKYIQSQIKVIDTLGNDMLIENFKLELL